MGEAMVPVLGLDSKIAPPRTLSAKLHADDAKGCFESSTNARLLIEQLLRDGHAADALRCITHLLPKEYVMVWAVSILRELAHSKESPISDSDRIAMQIVDRWLADSNEESRLSAQQFAEADEYSSPGGWLAAAAGWMAGSLAPADCDPVPPPADLPGEAVAACLVTLAAVRPDRQEELLARWVGDALTLFGGAGGRS